MIQFREYLKALIVDGDPEATYKSIMGELSARTPRLYVVDYTYEGKYFSAFVPAVTTLDIMLGVEQIQKLLPVAKNMHVDFSKLIYLETLDISLNEMNNSLIAYFLYFFRDQVDITRFKEDMIKYFESIEDYEKCGALMNYNTPKSTLL